MRNWSTEFQDALRAVEIMTGDKVIHAAFKKVDYFPDSPLRNNHAFDVYRNPERYQLIKAGYRGQDIYVEYRMNRGYDKHFWVEASAVKAIRDHFEKMATNNGVAHER